MIIIDKMEIIKLGAKIELVKREFFFYCNLMAPDFYKRNRKYLVELSSVVRNLQNVISHESLISLLPFIEDTEAELKKIEKENQVEQPSSKFEGLNEE